MSEKPKPVEAWAVFTTNGEFVAAHSTEQDAIYIAISIMPRGSVIPVTITAKEE